MHSLRTAALVVAFTGMADPARAQWSRYEALPAADVFSVEVQGDTILAGVVQAVWISTDRGVSWSRSADLPGPVTTVESVRSAGGRLWAGTAGKGVFVSTDGGTSWQVHNQGLTGGLFDSHLYVLDLATRGDSLLAATDGAGVYALRLSTAGPWSPFGSAFVGGAAGSVPDLEEHDGRILAPAGGNGLVFHNDPGETDWTESYLNNFGPAPGLQPRRATWTGSAWLVSTRLGCYRSADGASAWMAVGPAGSSRTDGAVVSRDMRTFAAFNSLFTTSYHASTDDGDSWQPLETFTAFTYDVAMLDTALVAARDDGLWVRGAAVVSAPAGGASAAPRLVSTGPAPARLRAPLRLTLPTEGRVHLEVFDLAGRSAGRIVDASLPAGTHEVTWEAADRPAGVYFVRLATPAGSVVARIVLKR